MTPQPVAGHDCVMRPFHYEAPETVSDAVRLLTETPGSAKIMAGGTDLLVQMRRGALNPARVIDVKRINELNVLAWDPDEGLRFGSAIPCAVLREDENLKRHYPGLLDAFSLIGGTATQGRATIGGNVGNAAPSADSIPALIVHGAHCRIAGPEGVRSLSMDQFCTGPGAHALEAGELLVSFHLPPPRPGSAGAYLRFIPRGEMDIAVAGVGVWLRVEEGMLVEARVALTSVAPIPLPVPTVSAFLIGKAPTRIVFSEAGEVAAAAARPITDHRGTADQRRHLIRILTERALESALKRIEEGGAFR